MGWGGPKVGVCSGSVIEDVVSQREWDVVAQRPGDAIAQW